MRKIYVVYARPIDYPGSAFVMRIHRIGGGKVKPTDKIWMEDTLEAVRQHVPKGCERHDRAERDEPQIVEWWA